MTTPSLLLGLVISTVYGITFHVWRGGSAGRLLLYLILGWAGFWSGHFLSARLGWSLFQIGSLNLGMATIGSLLFLVVGYWLSLVEPRKQNP